MYMTWCTEGQTSVDFLSFFTALLKNNLSFSPSPHESNPLFCLGPTFLPKFHQSTFVRDNWHCQSCAERGTFWLIIVLDQSATLSSNTSAIVDKTLSAQLLLDYQTQSLDLDLILYIRNHYSLLSVMSIAFQSLAASPLYCQDLLDEALVLAC